MRMSKTGIALALYRLRARYSVNRRRKLSADNAVDPRKYSAMCGWETGGSAETLPAAGSV